MEYRREIDGLRALAVIPVMFFHAGFQAFSGGFVGVDVFFVISGYLITSIILAEKHAGTFSIVNFYERRARRILPALFFMMLVCLPFAWLWLLPEDMKSFSQSLVAVSGFASNILFFWTTNYFSTAAEFKPLLHTWSLAVEEQYYLLFPLFLIDVYKRQQYTQLIARRVREIGVYCEIYPYDADPAALRAFQPRGIILSGGPESTTVAAGPRAHQIVFDLNVPLLGICYGMQTMTMPVSYTHLDVYKRQHRNRIKQDRQAGATPAQGGEHVADGRAGG